MMVSRPSTLTLTLTLTLLLSLLLVILCTAVHGRFITTLPSPSDLISDGVQDYIRQESKIPLMYRFSVSDSCDQTYGFMPCTTTVIGNLFLILVYSFLMYLSATYLFRGSELLLEILGPGIISGLFLPILGALPDALIILVSGLSGSTVTSQEQVSVGMGLLAGSTVMLLTTVWGTCVIVGKCDLQESIAIDKQDTKGFSLTGVDKRNQDKRPWSCVTSREGGVISLRSRPCHARSRSQEPRFLLVGCTCALPFAG